MATIINGREIADKINDKVRAKVSELHQQIGTCPKLVSLTIGHGDDARIYVNMQKKVAERVGIEFDAREMDDDITQDELVEEINKLNADKTVTSVIVQKPLPEHINHDSVVSSILPEKDAEGLHPMNLGKILRREADIVPSTPGAVMKILREENVSLYGKEVVVIGHSAIVGKPLNLMMLNEMATTTVCHLATAETGNLLAHTKCADILVVAVGNAHMVKADWIKEGAVVIDVGINEVDGKVVGDVEFDLVKEKASIISPVPGGVGPVTVSILMRNVLRAYRNQNVKS